MRLSKLIGAAAVSILGLTGLGGCIVATDEPVIVTNESTGLLTVRWSVAGSFDPQTCDFYGASDVELVIHTAGGREYKTVYGSCSAFQLTTELPIGSYRGELTLVRPDLTAVSTTLRIEPFRITEDTNLNIDVDFQTSSIL
jgi:hypothetical protein